MRTGTSSARSSRKNPFRSIERANAVADWSEDNVRLVEACDKDPQVNSLREVALCT